MTKTKIILAVTNDMVTDQRLNRVSASLLKLNSDVLIFCRKLKNSHPINNTEYKIVRKKMLFTKGPQFYVFFNLRLFIFLLFRKCDIIVSNDLDTLPGCFLASKLKRKALVFDSHEYFTEVPELQNNKFKQRIWKASEAFIVPKIKHGYTVCESLAGIYFNEYGIQFKTIRNLPFRKQNISIDKKLDIPENKFVIIYQGSLNMGRGLEKTILSLKYLDDAVLLVLGRGDVEEDLKKLVHTENLQSKVIFTGVIPYEQLHAHTLHGHLGISLEENIGLNYYYALPNKLFDYIQAKIPVFTSDFPEMKNIVNQYNIGMTSNEGDPKKLAEIFRNIISDVTRRNMWVQNLEKAAAELTWENEEKKLLDFYAEIIKKSSA